MKLKPYIQSEILLAKAAQRERFFGLAERRYERALILARSQPRRQQESFVYYRMTWFWLRQKQFQSAKSTFGAGNRCLLKFQRRQ